VNDFLDRFFALPRQQRIAVLAGLFLAVLALGYYFLVSPRSKQISDLADQIQNIRAERDKKKALAANLPKLTEQLRQLDGMLKGAVAQLPDSREIPDLLSTISSKAREAGLDILVFRPRAETPKEFYAEIPVDILVQGGFHNVAVFFDEVGRLARLVNINNIELRNPRVSGDQVTMEASALAITFRFLDEAERAKLAAQAKAAKK
jgi:type IV pilus assembly protein PilO